MRCLCVESVSELSLLSGSAIAYAVSSCGPILTVISLVDNVVV